MISAIFSSAKDMYNLLQTPIKNKKYLFYKYAVWSFQYYIFGKKGSGKETLFSYTIFFPEFKHFFSAFREIFIRNEYYFQTNLKDNVILDLGANIGLASIYFQTLYPRAHVIAYEPDTETFAYLQKNIAHNKLNVRTINKGVGHKTEKVTFYKSQNKGHLCMSTNKLRGGSIQSSIQIDSINAVLQPLKNVSFMKMDIEGSEFKVVEHMVSAHWNKIEQGFIEYHHHMDPNHSQIGRFLSMLETAGFNLQIDTFTIPMSAQGKFQDISIRFFGR